MFQVKRYFIIYLSLLSILNCASTVEMIPEPGSSGNLLIGSIVFDLDGYNQQFQTIYDDIEVILIGRYVQDGDLKLFSKWVETDENGYFYMTDVPDGEYALKGIRVRLFGDQEIKIYNELNDPQRNYYELATENIAYLHGELFDVKQDQRIINFEHNIFTLHRTGIIEFQRMKRIKSHRLSSGENLDSPPVASYFLESYGNTGWGPYLRLNLR